MAEREYRIEGEAHARDALGAVVDSLLLAARSSGEPVEVLAFLFSVRDGLRLNAPHSAPLFLC